MALNHTCQIQDYIKEISSLVLEIKDMPKEDRLFHFMNGLQPWVQSDMWHLNVQALVEAITYKEKVKGILRTCEDAPREKQFGKNKKKEKEKAKSSRKFG